MVWRLLVTIALLSLPDWGGAQPDLKDGAIVAYDANNHVQFFDIGHKKDGLPTDGGRIVNLVATVDGTTSTIGPFTEKLTTAPVGVASAMNYRDKYHLWLFSRLGSSCDSALCIDLQNGTFEKAYAGKGFLLSPSKNHVLYRRRVSHYHYALLVDSSTILPTQLPPFVITDDVFSPKTASGEDYDAFVYNKFPPEAKADYSILTWGWASERRAYAVIETTKDEATTTTGVHPVTKNLKIALSWPAGSTQASGDIPTVGMAPTIAVSATSRTSQEIDDLHTSGEAFTRGN